jgi:membrane protease YdiL (CAAX protease family)
VESNYNNSRGVSYTAGFFMLIGLAILGLVISAVIGGAILLASTSGGMESMKVALNDAQNANMLRLIQVGSVVIGMIMPALITAYILDRKPLQLLGFRKQVDIPQILLVIAIMFTSLFVAGALGFLNKDIAQMFGWGNWAEQLEKSYNEQAALMLDTKGITGYLVSLFVMGLLPAISEEMLFRGGLQNFLIKATKNPWLSILVVSLLFSLVHFSVYGFLVRFFLGIVLGYIFYSTCNLWLSITAHFFNNALIVSSIFFMTNQGKSMKDAMSKEVSATYWGFLALPIVVWLFTVLVKNAKKELNPDHGI